MALYALAMTMLMHRSLVIELARQARAYGREDFVAIVTDDGRVYTRSTRGVPRTLLALWRAEPAMAIPDDAGHDAATRSVRMTDL